MSTQKFTGKSTLNNKNRRQRGFSAAEVMVAVAVITVVAGIVIPQVYNEFQKARIASCKAELDLMKAVAYDLGDGRYIPTPDQFWGDGFPGAEEGEYYYIVDSQDANKGHGNDLDGCDEDNPGNSPRCPGMDIKFVVFCAHDHGDLAEYVYATESLPPTVVLPGEDDPFNFKSQKDKGQGNDPKPEGKEPKKPKKSK
jgi:prepilin-type N-terminal cleavage/methylation domain-containing protein